MLHSRDDNESHMDLPTFPEDSEDARAEVPMLLDAQTELLQGTSILSRTKCKIFQDIDYAKWINEVLSRNI